MLGEHLALLFSVFSTFPQTSGHKMGQKEESFTMSLVAGGVAGTSVDVILFPLDTIKTRLQSSQGFWKSGGFSSIYRGVGPAFCGSAPGAAAFFATYDTCKRHIQSATGLQNHPTVHMLSACIAEVAACFVRVPVEVVKQRRQAFHDRSVSSLMSQIWKTEGPTGFYRGYISTIVREIPFSIIQFPLWEFLKLQVMQRNGSINPLESSLCGALAGGLSAAVTTPLDVAKTRIMLAESSSLEARGRILPVLKLIHGQNGVKGLFAGVLPRTIWISIGGCIFFGSYELVKDLIR